MVGVLDSELANFQRSMTTFLAMLILLKVCNQLTIVAKISRVCHLPGDTGRPEGGAKSSFRKQLPSLFSCFKSTFSVRISRIQYYESMLQPSFSRLKWPLESYDALKKTFFAEVYPLFPYIREQNNDKAKWGSL